MNNFESFAKYPVEQLTKDLSSQQILKIFEDLGYYLPLAAVKEHVRHKDYASAIQAARSEGILALKELHKQRVRVLDEYFKSLSSHASQYGQLRSVYNDI